MKGIKSLLLLFFITIFILACSSDNDIVPTPKPKGYIRIDVPESKYNAFDSKYYKINLNELVKAIEGKETQTYFLNIEYSAYKATIHLAYFKLNNNLNELMKDARELAYRHTVKAEFINEEVYTNTTKNISAITYEIGGNAASNFQFTITDSTSHFLRGAMYYNLTPNADSLSPITAIIQKDIKYLIETIVFK